MTVKLNKFWLGIDKAHIPTGINTPKVDALEDSGKPWGQFL